MSGDGAGEAGIVADGLAGLEGRVWAQLLRSLRLIDPVPADVTELLARPASELASGAPRRALCAAVGASEDVVAQLRIDTTLPLAVHMVFVDADAARTHGTPASAADVDAGATSHTEDPAEEPAEERARELRRTLDDERRRREGAEARASTAEDRSRTADRAREAAELRVATLDEELAAAREEVAQAAARAERRSSARLNAVEQELAEARRALEELRRSEERLRGDLTTLRTERDELLAQAAARPDPSAGDDRRAASRPLVLPDELADGTTDAARWLADRVPLLLVDGYNAALSLRPDRPLEEQRRWLVERLRPLAHRSGLDTVVVFDGAGASGQARDTAGIEVRFTVGGTIADDEIVFAVAATDVPVLVITDDVELAQRVREEGGNVVGVVHLPGIVDG